MGLDPSNPCTSKNLTGKVPLISTALIASREMYINVKHDARQLHTYATADL